MSIKVLTNGRVLTALVMLGIFTTMTVMALGFPSKARLMPLMVGIPAVLLGLIQLISEYRAAASGAEVKAGNAQAHDAKPEKKEDRKGEIKMIVWTTIFFIALLCFGFVYASPVLVFAFLHFASKESLKISLISAVSTWLVIYLTFIKWFQIPLFKGLIVIWLLD